jgi:hypothetical protein
MCNTYTGNKKSQTTLKLYLAHLFPHTSHIIYYRFSESSVKKKADFSRTAGKERGTFNRIRSLAIFLCHIAGFAPQQAVSTGLGIEGR